MSLMGQTRTFGDIRGTSALRSIATKQRTSRDVGSGPILLKKSEYRLGPIFSAPWARFSDADAGGLVIRLRLNGASSKSICGGS